MKAILPILICSAISAALGYYFGHITVPADLTSSTQAPTTDTANAPAAKPEPEPAVAMAEDTFESDPAPMPAAPEAEPEPVDAAPEAATTPPAADNTSFAERAAQTTQTLTDTEGRTIQASIVEVTDNGVKIRRADGLVTTIPLSMLSAEDVAFCNYLREQQEPEPATPPDTSDGFDWDAYFNS